MLTTSVAWDYDPRARGRIALPTVHENLTADVCVVGLGGSGLAAVGECVRRGLTVVGVDAGRVGAGAGGRNGGFLLGGPAEAVHVAASTIGADKAVELYRRTLDEIGALRDELGPEIVRPTGSIRLAGLPGRLASAHELVDREQELADCHKQLTFMRSYGLSVEVYDGPLGTGLFLPDDAAMNPVLRVFALSELFRSSGPQLFENSRALQVDTGRVVTKGGTITAGLVVVAVDGRLEMLLPELAGRVETARLQMLATMPLSDRERLPCPVYGRWGFDYAQQDPSGSLFVGGGRDRFADTEWSRSDDPTDEVQDYLRRIADRFAGEQVTVTHQWAASVGYTADGRPVVLCVRPGVVACGGYNGTGNLIGPLAARAALALGLDGTTPDVWFNSAGTLSP